ncbi:MAG: hypothetical protein LPJ89_09015 [Hymenobacteraceae bacterium]|nr:hypothetical protein [Hymenobacteraceae bacterium]MDX5397245.1 hypothetical protein [Hymenobacteraceae bacterium]MDX5443904.1 hypothetical protein [Hymenobacteraceae bacterium]MDX5513321.1 hypothetical protein [Hymenobacteraceae bacterium]
MKNYLDVAYSSDNNIVVCRWFNVGNSEILRASYNHFFTTAQTFPTQGWLLDIRGRGKAEPEDDKWYFNYFLPEMVAGFKAMQYLAYLITPSHYEHVKTNVGLKNFDNQPIADKLTVKFFINEQDAVDWLVSCIS